MNLVKIHYVWGSHILFSHLLFVEINSLHSWNSQESIWWGPINIFTLTRAFFCRLKLKFSEKTFNYQDYSHLLQRQFIDIIHLFAPTTLSLYLGHLPITLLSACLHLCQPLESLALNFQLHLLSWQQQQVILGSWISGFGDLEGKRIISIV